MLLLLKEVEQKSVCRHCGGTGRTVGDFSPLSGPCELCNGTKFQINVELIRETRRQLRQLKELTQFTEEYLEALGKMEDDPEHNRSMADDTVFRFLKNLGFKKMVENYGKIKMY